MASKLDYEKAASKDKVRMNGSLNPSPVKLLGAPVKKKKTKHKNNKALRPKIQRAKFLPTENLPTEWVKCDGVWSKRIIPLLTV